jgi:hypothetical protein
MVQRPVDEVDEGLVDRCGRTARQRVPVGQHIHPVNDVRVSQSPGTATTDDTLPVTFWAADPGCAAAQARGRGSALELPEGVHQQRKVHPGAGPAGATGRLWRTTPCS